MPNVLQPEAEAPRRSIIDRLSLRAILFGAVLVAGAPGVIFGALQAANSYNIASQAENVVRSDDAIRASVRFDSALMAARDRAAAMSVSPTVLNAGAACSRTLGDVIPLQTVYSMLARTDAAGRINCASSPALMGKTLQQTDWFAALKGGQKQVQSSVTPDPLGGEAIIVAQALQKRGAFDGVAFVAIPRSWFAEAVEQDLGRGAGAVVAYDHKGMLIGAASRDVSMPMALVQAERALTARDGSAAGNGLSARSIETGVEGLRFVSVAPQGRQTEITLRAALIVLAPVLVSALSIVAIWFAVTRWVLRWFFRLRDAAEDFALGRYAPPPMKGAPKEIAALADAFDAAVTQSRAREAELATALAANKGLTRELHHRVKNNLQVLSSLMSRQQRRTEEPVVRNALGEARARMAPVALAYRFINPPEELIAIDMEAFLRELTRQLHVALNGDSRGVKLSVTADSDPMAVEDATNLGLIVAEAFVSGYGQAAGMSGAAATLTSTRTETGGHKVTMGVIGAADQGDGKRGLDRELIQELARQLRAEAHFMPSGLIELNLPPAPPKQN